MASFNRRQFMRLALEMVAATLAARYFPLVAADDNEAETAVSAAEGKWAMPWQFPWRFEPADAEQVFLPLVKGD